MEKSTSPLSDLLIASRQTKHLLSEASQLFEKKPELGLRFLQEKGVLPTPVTPSSIATFLRVAPGLSKDHVGGFLGELGKDNPKNDWDGKSFHVDVLLKYVESFALGGQPVLNCLRIFLSAFRLPGEAQQIDRILVAFSEYCHANSTEGRSGQIENPEITYLLTFSIIMLNTDRHNPNIRDDRRMTLEQFIRNNTNYGKDVNQTLPLSRDFLEQIYNSISEFPIRTERNDISATITQEMWMDLQLQSEVDFKKTILIGTDYPVTFLSDIADVHKTSLEVVSSVDRLLPAQISNYLLTSQTGYHLEMSPLQLSNLLKGLHWICDKDILDCVWHQMFYTSFSVYFHNFKSMSQRIVFDSSNPQSPSMDKKRIRYRERLNRSFQVSHEFLCDFIKLSCYHGLGYVLDFVIVLLVECAGVADVKSNVSEKVLNILETDQTDKLTDIGVDPISFIGCNEFLHRIATFSSARLSLLNLLQLIHSNQNHIRDWSLVWKLLSFLRDCAILPGKMVVDAEVDLLPINVRLEFENKLSVLDRIVIHQNQHLLVKPKKTKSSSSILSFQGLGEALFGSSPSLDDDEEGKGAPMLMLLDVKEFSPLSPPNLPSARWDLGYEEVVTSKDKGEESGQLLSIEDIRFID